MRLLASFFVNLSISSTMLLTMGSIATAQSSTEQIVAAQIRYREDCRNILADTAQALRDQLANYNRIQAMNSSTPPSQYDSALRQHQIINERVDLLQQRASDMNCDH